MDELQKIDILRERMNISYGEARVLLEECGWDLISALVKAEAKENAGPNWKEKVADKSGDVLEQVKGYISKGNRTRIKLKKDDKTVAEFPATAGVVGVLAALASTELAILAGIGAVAAVSQNVALEIEKDNGETKVIPLEFSKYKRRDEKTDKAVKTDKTVDIEEDIDF